MGFSFTRLVRRQWMPIVAVIVVAGAAFGVYRLHGIFGSQSNRASAAVRRTRLFRSIPSTLSSKCSGSRGRRDNQLSGRQRAAAAGQRCAAALELQRDNDAAGCVRQPRGAGRQWFDRMPHHDRRCGEGREIGHRVERLHLLLGQVRMTDSRSTMRSVSDTISPLAVPIIVFWLALAGLSNALVPQLGEVGRQHNVAQNPRDAPSLLAMKRMGRCSRSTTRQHGDDRVRGAQPLGPEAHRFYDTVIQRLGRDAKHVQHVDNFWGDPLTAAGSQSADGKAAYVQVYLTGDQGEAQSIEIRRRRS